MSNSNAGRRSGLCQRDPGCTLVEALVAVAVLSTMATMAVTMGGNLLARQSLESASRRLVVGLERARLSAQRQGKPCSLSLGADGWQPPESAVDGCRGVTLGLGEGVASGELRLLHNFPAKLRFSSNGLVLDGGTLVLAAKGTDLKRCLVMALPLGIVRLGRYGADLLQPPRAEACQPDPQL